MIARKFLALRGDQRGAAIIELALTAPLLAAIVVGMTDLSRGYSMKLMLEQASQRTIEQVENQKSVASSYNTALTSEATNAMADAGFAAGSYTVTPDSWTECSSDGTTWTRTASFTTDCAATDTTARYVQVSISSPFTPMFTTRMWPSANANGTITVTGSAEVRIQ